MTARILLRTAPCAALLIASAPALADVTADDVWAQWQAFNAALGGTVSAGSETREGDALILSDVAFVTETPDADTRFVIPEVTMTERGDGTVGIALSDAYEVEMTVPGPEGGTTDVTIAAGHDALEIVASGDPGAVDYDVSAETVTARLLSIDGAEGMDDAAFDMTLSGVAGTYGNTVPDGAGDARVTSDLEIGTVAISTTIPDPEIDGTTAITAELTDLGLVTEGDAAALSAADTGSSLFSGSLETVAELTYGTAQVALEIEAPDGGFAAAQSARDGTFAFRTEGGRVDYETGSSELEITVVGENVPLPRIAFGIAETRSEVSLMLAPTDDAVPSSILLRMEGISVDEEIWGLFDPEGALPRDPFDLTLDLEAQARVTMPLDGPEAAEAETPPFDVESLALRDLLLSAVGARLTGDGSVSFEGLAGAAAMPTPVGAIDLRLEGGQALIDRLVALGIVPEDQAMGARMMLGLFASPVEGEDAVTSVIEFDAGGGISANGQRIR